MRTGENLPGARSVMLIPKLLLVLAYGLLLTVVYGTCRAVYTNDVFSMSINILGVYGVAQLLLRYQGLNEKAKEIVETIKEIEEERKRYDND